MTARTGQITPVVSVIMPCFNSAETLATSVASALGQSMRDIELIVVDNDSSDQTVSIVESIRDTRIRILHQPIRGVSAARNMGIKAARGKFIAFLDSDDTWAAGCLAKLCAALASRPDAVLAYCGWQNVGLPGARSAPFVPPDYEQPNKIETLLAGCRWPIHAALTRTEAIREAGGFDTRFAYAEDFGLWLHVAAFARIIRVPEVLAFYHHRDIPRASPDLIRAVCQLRAMQRDFLRRHPDVGQRLGQRMVRHIVDGELLRRGMEFYWAGHLDVAHGIFRMVLKDGYLQPAVLRYLLPALLPRSVFRALVLRLRRVREKNAPTGA